MTVVKKDVLKKKTLWLVFLLGVSCVEPYEPPTLENGTYILVMEGSMNTDGKSRIRLTRSQNLSETKKVGVELKAIVSFEDEVGTTFRLTEEGDGNYALAQQSFDPKKRYRLTIKTADLKEYASAFVPIVKNSSHRQFNMERYL